MSESAAVRKINENEDQIKLDESLERAPIELDESLESAANDVTTNSRLGIKGILGNETVSGDTGKTGIIEENKESIDPYIIDKSNTITGDTNNNAETGKGLKIHRLLNTGIKAEASLSFGGETTDEAKTIEAKNNVNKITEAKNENTFGGEISGEAINEEARRIQALRETKERLDDNVVSVNKMANGLRLKIKELEEEIKSLEKTKANIYRIKGKEGELQDCKQSLNEVQSVLEEFKQGSEKLSRELNAAEKSNPIRWLKRNLEYVVAAAVGLGLYTAGHINKPERAFDEAMLIQKKEALEKEIEEDKKEEERLAVERKEKERQLAELNSGKIPAKKVIENGH